MAWSCGPGYGHRTTMAPVSSVDVDQSAVGDRIAPKVVRPVSPGHLRPLIANKGDLLTDDLRALMLASPRTALAG